MTVTPTLISYTQRNLTIKQKKFYLYSPEIKEILSTQVIQGIHQQTQY